MDIYISYKRDYSADLANNLYYRLTMRGFDVFYDIKTMGRGDYRTQIYKNIDSATDIVILIHPFSFQNVGKDIEDWFIIEVQYALQRNKNIIPVLSSGVNMENLRKILPDYLEPITFINSPIFSLSSINEYVSDLEQSFLVSKPQRQVGTERCTINFYSDKDCSLFFKGEMVGNVFADSNDPLCLNLDKYGQFIFVAKSVDDEQRKIQISVNEHQEIIQRLEFKPQRRKVQLKSLWLVAIAVLILPFTTMGYITLFDNFSAKPQNVIISVAGKPRTDQLQVDMVSLVADSLKTLTPQYSIYV